MDNRFGDGFLPDFEAIFEQDEIGFILTQSAHEIFSLPSLEALQR